LFLFQRKGTGGIGGFFGPVMAVWFATIAILGTAQIIHEPRVLEAVGPHCAVEFFIRNRGHGFIILGAVVLCITGGEALYADMGHFGWRPIRRSWYTVVCPGLLLNYFGQGALLLSQPDQATNPFYGLVPRILLYPMTALSTVAAVIASQALISGAFSLTRSAVQLGFLPRVRIIHTSEEARGQIYIPGVNTAMMIACLGLVLAFQKSSNLAAAYGIAVTAVMTITSVTWFVVADRGWEWSRWKTVPLVGLFLLFDIGYFSANVHKMPEGGWFPIVVALFILAIMSTWQRGREILATRVQRRSLPIELFIDDAKKKFVTRVPGAAVFMSSATAGTPPVLLHHIKHNKVLHEKIVLLSIHAADVPKVPPDEMLSLERLDFGFFRLTARYGFMETPNVPAIMKRAQKLGLKTETMETSFYLGRETLLTGGDARLARWRKRLFAFLSKNAVSPTTWFGLPPGRVIELGMQVDL
jgi:KUP system potassium uptake protein